MSGASIPSDGRTPPRRALTATARQAATGSALPLRAVAGSSSYSMTSRVAAYVKGPTVIAPGSATCWSRAAVLTASPGHDPVALALRATEIDEDLAGLDADAEAELRLALGAQLAGQLAHRACISRAARTARSASSSWMAGTPKTASIASPANFSTVPS